jgi:amidophosphoribosyltransferase
MLTLLVQELIARGKTQQEIADLIHADEVIFQDLEDLKASCMEVADSESKVTDFEVGVFSGQYQTDVPRSYFEKESQICGSSSTPQETYANGRGAANAFLVASSGPAGLAGRLHEAQAKK